MALTKVSGGILDPGINVAGIVTATGFDGPFTGGSSKNITAGIITATGFDLNGNGDISGNLVIGGNLTANGDFTTLNTTLREVEILRVDANTTAVAGIITQRGSGDIFSAYDTSTEVFKIADGGDVLVADKIVHLGDTNCFISFPDAGDQIVFEGGGHERFRINGTTGKYLFGRDITGRASNYNNTSVVPTIQIEDDTEASFSVAKFSNNTDSSRIFLQKGRGSTGSAAAVQDDDTLGMIVFNGYNGSGFRNAAQILAEVDGEPTSSGDNTDMPGALVFKTSEDGTNIPQERLRITSDGKVGIGTDNPGAKLDVYAGTNVVSTFLKTVNAKSYIEFEHNAGATYNTRFGSATLGAGNVGFIFETGLASSPVDAMVIDRYGKVGIGTNVPQTMHHLYGSSGLYTRFESSQGQVNFGNSNGAGVIHVTSTSQPLRFLVNGSNERLRITHEGEVRIPTGTYSTGRLTFGGGINIYHDGNMKFENYTGYLKLQCNNEINIDGSPIYFRNSGGTNRWIIDSSGHLVPGAADTYNIGSATAEIGDVFLASDKALKFGNSQIGDLYVGSDNVTYLRNSTGQMVIRAAGDIYISDYSGNHRAGFRNDNAVDLYFDIENNATPKLSTTATGITVTGEVATTQDYPTFQPTLDFNFAAEKKLDPRITFQRTGPASFTDKFGKVVLVNGNVPRFDHDPITGECKGLLIEQNKTNYVRVSTNLASQWVAGSGSFAVDNSITNPDGSIGAYYHTGAELYHENINLSSASTNVITVSLWVKERSGQSGNLDIEIFQQISGSVISLGAFSFDPATEVLGTAPSTFSDGKVVEYPNGWYRVSVKATTASGNFSSSTRYDMQNAEHYVWGMQMETGSFPTSFIPTYGSTEARGQDLVEITEEEFVEFYNQTEGSIVSEFMLPPSWPMSGYASITLTLSDNSYNNRITLASSTGSAAINADVAISGSTTRASLGSYTSGSYSIKAAMAYKASDSGGSLNGAAVVTTSPGTLPLLTRADIGKDHQNGNALNGHMKRIMYYSKRLPNSQLVTLTS